MRRHRKIEKPSDEFDDQVAEFTRRVDALCDEFSIWLDRATIIYDGGIAARIGPLPTDEPENKDATSATRF